MNVKDIENNLRKVREKIDKVSIRCGRNPNEVRLIGVTKTFGYEVIQAGIDLGITDIGENYVQEFAGKKPFLDPKEVRFHMIGHLQTNKVKEALELFDVIHSVDRLKLAEKIQKEAEKMSKVVPVLVQVNTSAEESKFGIEPVETVTFVRSLTEFRNIEVIGLMTLAAFLDDPETVRPMFRVLKNLRDEINQLHVPGVHLKELSMGMSNDYPVAIEEGATMIRVGTALFGARD